MSTTKRNLIALVATAVIVNGERTVINAGEPLPELKREDEDALMAAKAAREAAQAHTAAPAAAAAPATDQPDTADVQAADPAPEPAASPPPAPKPKPKR